MPMLTIDARGRIVIPLPERHRLGLVGGSPVELIPTPEGLLLEPRREATVRIAADGLPVLEFSDGRGVARPHVLRAARVRVPAPPSRPRVASLNSA